MSELTLYWRGWSEGQLAGFQQDQGKTNHCAKYAAASALNILYGTSLSGDELVAWIESRFLRGTGLYTILGNNNGSLVFQTGNLIRKLAVKNGLNPVVRSGFGTLADLRDRLQDGSSLILVSVTYFQGQEPLIARGTNLKTSLGATRIFGGHLMILVAYDPDHMNESGVNTPWGFLSSWPGQEYLFWMTEEDFRRSWGKLSYFNMITMRMGKGDNETM